jgi:hypothetical protein
MACVQLATNMLHRRASLRRYNVTCLTVINTLHYALPSFLLSYLKSLLLTLVLSLVSCLVSCLLSLVSSPYSCLLDGIRLLCAFYVIIKLCSSCYYECTNAMYSVISTFCFNKTFLSLRFP